MKIYLVGGAIRDRLLGLEVSERDWVVIGSSHEQMIKLGFISVGKDFPVFLHPRTKEEYALARTEKKKGHGYKGFTFETKEDVSLFDDLKRRDLTINAIAEDDDGNIVDPYNGLVDIENKVLRHISSAFVEDPVRLVRIARFAAKFPEFTVHDTTKQLLKDLVKSGELLYLTVERVWLELEKALKCQASWKFFEVLHECGANEVLWPGFLKHNYAHLLEKVANENVIVKFSALCVDQDLSTLSLMLKKYKVPRSISDIAILVAKYANEYYDLTGDSNEVVSLLYKLDAWRRPQRLDLFCKACNSYTRCFIKDLDYLKKVFGVIQNVSLSDIPGHEKIPHQEISKRLFDYRVKVLENHSIT
ncbi:MAG: multifunctional CCA tRNA nucleotidyl transferase/2'3'-cyclic phosphodiesterase/2'nucleotidase/phosphatase [Pseudomonadota bacterium]|nr:multifunctional CCA tRNA nucleotidyl transferase/2'3'-cyclic phosphodiesterase/2'nucleotidase/phosphatase [Pseudomonadota bacterium]